MRRALPRSVDQYATEPNRALSSAADRVEASADALAAWMRSLPIDSPQRLALSLRAGERYEVVREMRALVVVGAATPTRHAVKKPKRREHRGTERCLVERAGDDAE